MSTNQDLFTSESIPEQGPEIIIGLVGAAGAPLGDITHYLQNSLNNYDYNTFEIRLSKTIQDVMGEIDHDSEYDRIIKLQKLGNDLRERSCSNDAVAVLSLGNIRDYRQKERNNRHLQVPRQAYILNSLKTPEEVKTLRNIYGDGFILIAAFSPELNRKEKLAQGISEDEEGRDSYKLGESQEIDSKATEIIEEDRYQQNNYGQNVRETFPLADIFLDTQSNKQLVDQINRSIDLLFGHPFETPKRDEHSMYIAEGARFRSSALGRQVGAALTRPEGEILSVGCNDVPSPDGGLYWNESDPDFRDFRLDVNLTQEKKLETLRQILENLDEMNGLKAENLNLNDLDWDDSSNSDFEFILNKLGDTRLADLIEFYRSTHAEMEAILSASRKGISVENSTLYSTTFPCHECTRHIITSGINRVVYIEPYPKSLGPDLHGDSVEVKGGSIQHEIWNEFEADLNDVNQIKFDPFVGIGPRIFEKVFKAEHRKKWAYNNDWPGENPIPKFCIRKYGWFIDEVKVIDRVKKNIN